MININLFVIHKALVAEPSGGGMDDVIVDDDDDSVCGPHWVVDRFRTGGVIYTLKRAADSGK